MKGTTEIQGKKFNWNLTNGVFRKWTENAGNRNFSRIMSGNANYSEACDLFFLAVENAEQETKEGKKVKYSYSVIEGMIDDLEFLPIKEISLAVLEMISKSIQTDDSKKKI